MTKTEEIKNLIARCERGTASPLEKDLVNSWLYSDSDLEQWFTREISDSNPLIDTELLIRFHPDAKWAAKHFKIKSNPSFRFWLVAAAVAIIVLGVGFFSIHNNKTYQPTPFIVTTGPGEHTRITLNDGTKVILNSLTELKFINNQADHKRIVKLNGEAVFDVAHDSNNPFIVQSRDLEVECTGTIFDVKAYKDRPITVVLNEGSVIARTETESVAMKPDQKVIYDSASSSLIKSSIESSEYLKWTTGSLHFENEALRDICLELEQIYGVEIKFDSEEIANMRISGNMDHDSLKEALTVITALCDANYTIDSNGIVTIKTP